MSTTDLSRAVAIALFLFAMRASASTDSDRAEKLFQEAKALMDAGRYKEACPKLAEAQQLHPGGGTLLALAICHEGEGRGATALPEFREALAIAKKANRADRIQLAESHIKKLEADVSRIIVEPSDRKLKGLAITLDGVAVEPSRWNVGIAVDAGAHVVRATADEKKPFEATITVASTGDVKRVPIELQPTNAPTPKPVEPDKPKPVEASNTATVGWIVGGVGVVALGVGGYFGIRTLSETKDYKSQCPGGACTEQSAIDLHDRAKLHSTISTVALIGGVAAVSVGVFLIVRSPSGEKSSARIAPVVAPTLLGFSFGGSF